VNLKEGTNNQVKSASSGRSLKSQASQILPRSVTCLTSTLRVSNRFPFLSAETRCRTTTWSSFARTSCSSYPQGPSRFLPESSQVIDDVRERVVAGHGTGPGEVTNAVLGKKAIEGLHGPSR
jgi:hypothetical protein